MELKRKTLRRTEWTRITRRETAIRPFSAPCCSGQVCLITIRDLTGPLYVNDSPFGRVLIADRGYRWLQFAPQGQHWWLTVMFDETGALVQSYFDITRENCFDGPDAPWFTDLFLDIAIPDRGEPVVLDEDELLQALSEGIISQDEYQLAHRTAQAILRWYAEHTEEYYRFLEQCLLLFAEGELI